MDLGPVIRIIENVPATAPLEQPEVRVPREPVPAREPQPA